METTKQTHPRVVLAEPWGPAALARARREGRPLVLLADAASGAAGGVATSPALGDVPLPSDVPGAVYVAIDEDAEPAVALRARWMLRLFDCDERPPYAIVCLARRGGRGLLPLYAVAAHESPGVADARAAVIAAWGADRNAVERQAVRNRRALGASARRGWRARPALDRVLSVGRAALLSDVDGSLAVLFAADGALRPTALWLLLAEAAWGNAAAGELARQALSRLAVSRLRDPLDGGFFHGRVPEAAQASNEGHWDVPDFARTAAGNAALLALYAAAAVQLAEPAFVDVARGIASYLLDTLRAPDGGFFTGQRPDPAYYTWTTRQVAGLLPFDRVQVACLRFNVQPTGGPLADPRLNVLYPAMDAATLAHFVGGSASEAAARIAEVEDALRAARSARPAPPLDRPCGLEAKARVASALLGGAVALGQADWRDVALEALDGLQAEHVRDSRLAPSPDLGTGEAGEPYLGEYVARGRALLDAHAVSGDRGYLAGAEAAADALLATFRDPGSGALLDAPRTALVSRAFWPEQPFEDGAGLSPAALAVGLLLDLARETRNGAYRQAAIEALRAGAAAAADDPSAAAGYYVGLDALLASEEPRPA